LFEFLKSVLREVIGTIKHQLTDCHGYGHKSNIIQGPGTNASPAGPAPRGLRLNDFPPLSWRRGEKEG
jgi:hypothetical protein